MQKKLFYLIYKPYGINSQFSGDYNLKSIMGLEDVSIDVYPVGRLDRESEGLLILTNEKSLNDILIGPANLVHKEYWVQVDGAINEEVIHKLISGLSLKLPGGKVHKCAPALAKRMNPPAIPEREPPVRFRKSIPTSWISITLQEGKNHQVRRMTAAVGFPTLRLIRIKLGPFELPEWEPGAVQLIPENEVVNRLRQYKSPFSKQGYS